MLYLHCGLKMCACEGGYSFNFSVVERQHNLNHTPIAVFVTYFSLLFQSSPSLLLKPVKLSMIGCMFEHGWLYVV